MSCSNWYMTNNKLMESSRFFMASQHHPPKPLHQHNPISWPTPLLTLDIDVHPDRLRHPCLVLRYAGVESRMLPDSRVELQQFLDARGLVLALPAPGHRCPGVRTDGATDSHRVFHLLDVRRRDADQARLGDVWKKKGRKRCEVRGFSWVGACRFGILEKCLSICS